MTAALRLVVLLSCCAVAPFASGSIVHAQPAPPFRVGTLGADPTQVWDVFQRRLRDLGYVEGRNLILERRWSNGYEDRLPRLMADLLRTNPRAIVTSSMLSTGNDLCVPILVIAVSEWSGSCRPLPVLQMSERASAHEVSATHLRLARALVPAATRFSVLTNSERPFLLDYLKGLEAAAASAGVAVHVLDVSSDAEIGNFDTAITRQAPDVLIVGPRFLPRPDWRRQIVKVATARGIPSVGSYVGDGVVVAADYDWAALARRAADFVDQLLKGVTPGDLATAAPAKFEVTVDERVAKSLRLSIPESLLSQADRVLD
jgi:putative ABC transport system substrate-binding protein